MLTLTVAASVWNEDKTPPQNKQTNKTSKQTNKQKKTNGCF